MKILPIFALILSFSSNSIFAAGPTREYVDLEKAAQAADHKCLDQFKILENKLKKSSNPNNPDMLEKIRGYKLTWGYLWKNMKNELATVFHNQNVKSTTALKKEFEDDANTCVEKLTSYEKMIK
jgi:hypothetical protein